MKTSRALEIYYLILENPNDAAQFFKEIFGGNTSYPTTYEFAECSESMITKIDWGGANRMVMNKIIEIISKNCDSYEN